MEPAIACIGAANIDRKAQCLQPVVLGSSNPVRTTESAGGVARNVCENLARLGCRAGLFAPLGNDEAARRIAASLTDLGVAMGPLDAGNGLPTATYTALTDPKGELVIGMADLEICDNVPAKTAASLAESLSGYPIWFVDTNLPQPFLDSLLSIAPDGVFVAADTVSVAKASKIGRRLDRVGMLFCNAAEAAALAGPAIRAPLDTIMTAHKLRDRGVGTVVITRGADGCYVAADDFGDFAPAIPVELVDVTGAGDALAAGMLFAHVAGMPTGRACRFGLAAAALTCQTTHTVNPEMSREALESMVEHE